VRRVQLRRWAAAAAVAAVAAAGAAGCGKAEEGAVTTTAQGGTQPTGPTTPQTTASGGSRADTSPPTTKVNFGTGTTLFLEYVPGGKPGLGTITVTNDTVAPVRNVVVTVPKADLASVLAAGVACEQRATDFRCRLGSLAPGQKVELSVALAPTASTTALGKGQGERLTSIRVATDVADIGTKEVTVRAPLRVLPRS
jgi:hypothetical protein